MGKSDGPLKGRNKRLRVELRDTLHYGFLLRFGQLRKHGQRQHFRRSVFRLRQVSSPVAQVSETRLQMQRDGIVDLGAYFSVAKKLAQLIAALSPNHVLMKDMKCMWRSLDWCDRRIHSFRCKPSIGQQAIVGRRPLPALLVPGFDMRQLYAEDGGLDRVHAAVPPEFFMMVAARAAVIAQLPHVLSQI